MYEKEIGDKLYRVSADYDSASNLFPYDVIVSPYDEGDWKFVKGFESLIDAIEYIDEKEKENETT